MTNDAREDAGAVIVAAGRSERMGGADKLWAPLTDATGHTRPLLALSIAAFESCAAIDRIVLVVAPDVIESAQDLVREEEFSKVEAVIAGGARRQDSVRAGLEALEACAWVAVHDGARPLATPALIERGLDAARETGASCCAMRVADTVKEEDGGYAARTLDRGHLWLAQTPQVFRYDLLLDAHQRCESDATDDASMLEGLGVRVRLYEGSPRNLKVTTEEDLALVQALLEQP